MNNKYNKINKKVGGTRVKSLKSKVQSRRGISEVGFLKTYVGLTKSYIKKSYIKRVGVVGLVIFAVAAVWAVMPAKGAEAAFSCDSNDGTTCTVSGAKTMTKAEPIRL